MPFLLPSKSQSKNKSIIRKGEMNGDYASEGRDARFIKDIAK
jgi:hypothetical protein